jgi:Tol biopolymer transport system component
VLALVFAPGGASLAVPGTFRIDVETGTQLSPDGAAGFGARYSPDGKEVLSSRCCSMSSGKLFAMDVDSGVSREITRVSHSQPIAAPRWSPDGSTIAFWLNPRPADCPEPQGPPCGRGQIWLVRSDGTGLHKFSDDAVKPAWSPDSQQLAFLGDFDMHAQTGVVMAANVDGTARRALGGRGAGSGPEWSADGRFIAYTRTNPRGYHERVRIVEVAGGQRTQKTLGASRSLSWSPSGSTLAYAHHVPGRVELYVIDLGTGKSRKLVSTPRLSRAAWSPDARLLAYDKAGKCDVGPTIVVVRAAGGVVRRVQTPAGANSLVSVTDLAWGADGRSVLGETMSVGLVCIDPGRR